jgi:ABC-type phosphate transport system substrate-binding protein
MNSKIIILFLCSLSFASADVVLVVNENSGLTSAKKTDILKIFTGRGTQLNDVGVKPIVQKKDLSHEEFLQKYIFRTNIQFSNAWKKLVFTGKASMPEVAESDAEVVRAILSDAKLIGYVDRSNVVEGLTILELK